VEKYYNKQRSMLAILASTDPAVALQWLFPVLCFESVKCSLYSEPSDTVAQYHLSRPIASAH